MPDITGATNYFPRSYENTVPMTLSGSVTAGAATIGINGMTNYTDGDVVCFVVDPSTPALKQVFTGTKSGASVVNAVWTEFPTGGVNVNHAGGATVIDYATATDWDLVQAGILKQHKQTGAHSAVTADSVAATGNISSSAGTISTTLIDSLKDAAIALSTYRSETSFAHVASGLVITADSAGTNRNWSMTAGVVYINGRRIAISALSAQTATASRDTYVDILDNADGTGTVVMTGGNIVTNNNASPALAANSLRIGIIVAGATTIAAAASINQGQEDRVLPIASSNPYAVTDSLGNRICPRDPQRKLLGYRQVTTNQATTSGTFVDITGLSVPVIVPTGRKIKATVYLPNAYNTTTTAGIGVNVYDVTNSIQLNESGAWTSTAGGAYGVRAEGVKTPSATSNTYKAQFHIGNSGTANTNAGPTTPAFILVELI